MSIGIGFHAELVDTDGVTAVYRYSTYDLNCAEGRGGYGTTDLDGILWAHGNGPNVEFEVERYSRHVPDDPDRGPGASLTQRLINKLRSIYGDTGEYPELVVAHY